MICNATKCLKELRKDGFDISRSTLLRLKQKKKIPFMAISENKTLYDPAEVAAAIRASTVKAMTPPTKK
jgi:hypothetical protein